MMSLTLILCVPNNTHISSVIVCSSPIINKGTSTKILSNKIKKLLAVLLVLKEYRLLQERNM